MTAALTTVSLAHLDLPDHDDLIVQTSRDNSWYHTRTVTGRPADFSIEWTETTDAGDDEVSHITHTAYGQFDHLKAVLDIVLPATGRTPNTPVTLDFSEWALLYQRAS
jgi:hypothetical protein